MIKKNCITCLLSFLVLINSGISVYAAGELMDGTFDTTTETNGIISNDYWTGNFKTVSGSSCVTKEYPSLKEEPADSGNWMAYFYGEGFTCKETGFLSQTGILVKQNAKLKFSLKITKSSISFSAGTLYIKLKNESTNEEKTVAEFSQSDAGNRDWVEKEIDLSNYVDAQQTQTLIFDFLIQETDPAFGKDLLMYVDNLVLTSCDVEAGFSVTDPDTGSALTNATIGVPVNFKNESTGEAVDNNTATWLWNFNSSPFTGSSVSPATYSDHTPTPVTFNKDGDYIVKLIGTGTDGCTSEVTQAVTVVCDVQTVLPEDKTVKVGEDEPFTNSSTWNDGITPTWVWDITDSTGASIFTSEDRIPNPFQFPKTGTYTVKLTASSSTGSGCETSDTQTVTVVCNVNAGFNFVPETKTQVKVGEAFTVNNTSDNKTAEWSWDFKEPGNYTDSTNGSESPTFTYNFPLSQPSQIIEIQLTATGAGGCTTTTTQNIEVICDAQANFSSNISSDRKIYSGQTINFFTDPDVSIDYQEYTWSFGDGDTNTTSLNPSHTYTNDTDQVINLTLKLTTKGTSECQTVFPDTAVFQEIGIIPALGNVNGDDYLDLKDAVNALQIAAGFGENDLSIVDINLDYCDINKNGIGLEEAVYVLQKVAKLR